MKNDITYKDMLREIERCQDDPVYFIDTHVRHANGEKILLTADQKSFITTAIANKGVLGIMGRRAGKTSTSLALLLWAMIFRGHRCAYLSPNSIMSMNAGAMLLDMIKQLPAWMRVRGSSRSGEVKVFSADNEAHSGVVYTGTDETVFRGRALDVIVLDELLIMRPESAEAVLVEAVISVSLREAVLVIPTSLGNLDTERRLQRLLDRFPRITVPVHNEEMRAFLSKTEYEQEYTCTRT